MPLHKSITRCLDHFCKLCNQCSRYAERASGIRSEPTLNQGDGRPCYNQISLNGEWMGQPNFIESGFNAPRGHYRITDEKNRGTYEVDGFDHRQQERLENRPVNVKKHDAHMLKMRDAAAEARRKKKGVPDAN